MRVGLLEAMKHVGEVHPIALHIVTPPGRNRPARVQAFMDYATDRFMNEPWAELQQPLGR